MKRLVFVLIICIVILVACSREQAIISSPQVPNSQVTTSFDLFSCTTILAPGTYTLRANSEVGGGRGACIHIVNTSAVTFSCSGATITSGPEFSNYALLIENSQDIKVHDCSFEAKSTVHSWSNSVLISQSSNVTIKDTSFSAGVVDALIDVVDSSHVLVSNNVIAGTVQLRKSNDSSITQNRFSPPRNTFTRGAHISVGNGVHNTITNNIMDGVSDGIFHSANDPGFDDGIVLYDESFASINNNTISNVWDCGIETSGTIIKSVFEENIITNAGVCGIGGWYWSNWENNTVKRNIVTDSPHLFRFARNYGLRPGETQAYFRNNEFTNNALLDARDHQPGSLFLFRWYPQFSGLSSIPGEREILENDLDVRNNILHNNDFDKTTFAPVLQPITGFVDGGSNSCGANTQGYTDYFTLECN